MNIIAKKQNEPNLLRIQFSARQYYNRAEKVNYFIWLLCILSEATGFFPLQKQYHPYLIVFVFVIDITAFFLERYMEKCISIAADSRRMFDSYVFNLNEIKTFTHSTLDIKEYAIKESNKKPLVFSTQIKNTGKDSPPGVKDWYNTQNDLEGNEAIYECQLQNIWWDKKITVYQKVMIVLLGILIVVSIMVAINVEGFFSTFLACLSPVGLLFKLTERINVHIKYWKKSISIDTIIEEHNAMKEHDFIICLQNKLDERRAIPLVHMNAIHKKLALKFSNIYSEVSST